MKIQSLFPALKLASILIVIQGVAACSWLFGDDGTFRDRGNDYRQASLEKKLSLPTGIDSDAIYDSYAIPPINDNTSLDKEFEVPRPEPLSEDVGRETVRISKLANDRWILVNGSPGHVWPRLRGFLSLNQLSVQRVDAANGILETEWIQPAIEGVPKERYQLRIEQGVQRDTSEVYVLQADIGSGADNWPKNSSNDEREELITTELAQYLANSTNAAAVSMLAQQTINSSGRVNITENANKEPSINLQLPFPRAWASLRSALDKAGYVIDDLDRSKHYYFVSYSEQQANDEEPGFFASLFSSDEKGSNDKASDAIDYLISVKELTDKSVEVTIKRQDDYQMEKPETEHLLKLIKRHIS